MFNLNNLLRATILFVLILNIYGTTEGPLQLKEADAKVLYTKSENIAILTQLKSNATDSVNSIYTYKCTVGTKRSSKFYLKC